MTFLLIFARKTIEMSELIPLQFDYAGNGIDDATTIAKLNELSQRGIAVFTKTSIQMTAVVGEILSQAQELLSSHSKSEGVFCKWATCTFGLSKTQVYRILSAWDKYLCNGTERFKQRRCVKFSLQDELLYK